MSIYYVYAYLRQNRSANGPAGSPYYIGKGQGRRIYNPHKNCSARPPKDRRFAIKVFDNLALSESLALEKALIKIFGRLDLGTGCLRNLTDGGDGVIGISNQTRSKLSAKSRGRSRKHSEETKKKISIANTGRTPTQTTIEKMSLAHLGKKLTKDQKDKISASMMGNLRSEETRRKLSIANIGKKHTEESRKKMSMSQTGKIVSEETRAKMRVARQKFLAIQS